MNISSYEEYFKCFDPKTLARPPVTESSARGAGMAPGGLTGLVQAATMRDGFVRLIIMNTRLSFLARVEN